MAKPRKKKMGRPFEDVPLRKLVKSVRQEITDKLADVGPAEAVSGVRKSKKK